MATTLFGHGLESIGRSVSDRSLLGRICERADVTEKGRNLEILRITTPSATLPPGFLAYFFDTPPADPPECNAFTVLPGFRHLSEGDVVRVDTLTGAISVLYRKASHSNVLMVTERCNNRCLMCSQPPGEATEAGLLDETKQLISLMSPETQQIGISGGEPGLLGPKLVELVERLKTDLPRTAVHILSNGRPFADRALAVALGKVQHPDLMVGVALHSDLPEEHDYIAQAHGAFDETVRGILNLKQARVRVELRLVIHAVTKARLPEFADFVARNLLFVDHVALMGLELEGYARGNIDLLWTDPLDYMDHLTQAVRRLVRAGSVLSIYNLPRCVLPDELHPYARQSISDWKTVYVEECEGCERREGCCGLFASGVTLRSRGIGGRRSCIEVECVIR